MGRETCCIETNKINHGKITVEAQLHFKRNTKQKKVDVLITEQRNPHGKGKYRSTDNTKIGKVRGNPYQKNEEIPR